MAIANKFDLSLEMFLLRKWTKKAKQNENPADPEPSLSNEYTREPTSKT